MNDKHNFTEGSILKKMLSFMLPILCALILQDVYGAVDLLIVGRFGTSAGISGVATGTNIMHFMTILFAGLTSAVTVLLGRNIGAGEPEKNSALIGNTTVFFLVCALVCSFLLFIFAEPISRLMQAPEESLLLTAQYIRICGAGFVFVVFYNYISAIFRGIGDSGLPLLFVGIASVINVLGDLLLVAVFKMNVAGAAIATIAAQAISVLLSLLIIRKKQLSFTLSKNDFRLGHEIGRVMQIGTPIVLQDVLTNLTFLALNAFVNRLGVAASSGYGVAQKITAFVMLVPTSLMQSMAPFVSQNVGAKKEDRAVKAMSTGMLIGTFIGVIICTFAFLKGDILARIFTDDASVVTRAFEYLRGFSPDAILTSVLFSFLGYFNGHERTRFVLIQGLIQSFLIRLPMSYLMSIREHASLTGVGLAAPTATVFGIVMCIFYYRRVIKDLRQKQSL